MKISETRRNLNKAAIVNLRINFQKYIPTISPLLLSGKIFQRVLIQIKLKTKTCALSFRRMSSAAILTGSLFPNSRTVMLPKEKRKYLHS